MDLKKGSGHCVIGWDFLIWGQGPRACHDFFFNPRTHRSLRERPFPPLPLARSLRERTIAPHGDSNPGRSLRFARTRTASKFSAFSQGINGMEGSSLSYTFAFTSRLDTYVKRVLRSIFIEKCSNDAQNWLRLRPWLWPSRFDVSLLKMKHGMTLQ